MAIEKNKKIKKSFSNTEAVCIKLGFGSIKEVVFPVMTLLDRKKQS